MIIVLSDNKLRLKFYESKLPKYTVYSTGLNTYLCKDLGTSYKNYSREINRLRKFISKEGLDYVENSAYLTNTSFSIRDEDIFNENVRVFIDKDGDIYLGKIEGYDDFIINSIDLFIVYYLKGISSLLYDYIMLYRKKLTNDVYDIDMDLVNNKMMFSGKNNRISIEIKKDMYIYSNSSYKRYKDDIDEYNALL